MSALSVVRAAFTALLVIGIERSLAMLRALARRQSATAASS
jgi:hypothetical protein